jgi:hypothetical protein
MRMLDGRHDSLPIAYSNSTSVFHQSALNLAGIVAIFLASFAPLRETSFHSAAHAQTLRLSER